MADAKDDVEVVLNSKDVADVLTKLKSFDPKLSTQIRRRIRDAAKIVMGDAQSEIRSYPAAHFSTSMREQLAASLAVRIYTSSTRQGVQIVSTGRLLPAEKKTLAKAMNAATVRHPVWGHRTLSASLTTSLRKRKAERGKPLRWVEQKGIRFFSQKVVTRHESEVVGLMVAAVDDAVEAMNQ
jgi:hypothetical protein